MEESQQVETSSFNYLDTFNSNKSELESWFEDQLSFPIYMEMVVNGQQFKRIMQQVFRNYTFSQILKLKIRVKGNVKPNDLTVTRACAGLMYIYYTKFIKNAELEVESMIIPSLGDRLPRPPDSMDDFHKMYCMAGAGFHYLPALFLALHGSDCKEIGGTLTLACMVDWAKHRKANPAVRISLMEYFETKALAMPCAGNYLQKCINNLGDKVQQLTDESLEYLFFALKYFTSTDGSNPNTDIVEGVIPHVKPAFLEFLNKNSNRRRN